MAKTAAEAAGPLKKGAKVRATADIAGREHLVEEGTAGKVTFVAGFGPWFRYRVRFDNGESIGSIDRHLLEVPGENDEKSEVGWLFR